MTWLSKALQPLPPLPSWVRRLIRPLYFACAIPFALIVVVDAVSSEMITLGPGLVDHAVGPWDRLLALLHKVEAPWWWILLPALGAVLAWNGLIFYRSGRTEDDDALNPRQTLTFLLLNAVLATLLGLSIALLGGISAISGRGFTAGFEIVRGMTETASGWLSHIPTLVELPYPLPLFASMLAVDFFHYWFHRLGHTWRPFWLLWHRPHHLTPYLTIPTTQPVFAAVPLFVVLSIPFQLAIGLGAKLFHPETMIAEALLLRCVGQIATIGSHSSATYALFANSRCLRALGWFYGEGPYHYVHHSSLPEHALVNLGATPMMFWDRIFGTYTSPPPTRPPIGIAGQPPLHSNPLRLALAGILTLAYELRHNPGLGVRLRILFGSARFLPPITKDFILE
jgi:sterol desaturase/sphingolipid hydroxylase (fatty acid hydroxylase superfamily)